MTDLILASSSPYRRNLLTRLGLPFEHCSPDIDESPLADEAPKTLAARLSQQKAQAVAETYSNSVIIGSDQVAECSGEFLSKPQQFEAACEQLRRQSSQRVTFYTGLCVLDTRNNHSQVDVVITQVQFRQLSDNDIVCYLNKEKPFNCAGSFKVEQLGIALFESVGSQDPTALEGLPLIRLCQMLRQAGFQLP
ncbi:septum formation inhibitor Maf [bacterium SCSIO 12696]|nr:septum formation inhibitor Maf [bacterium SCSIO 12696]